MKITANLKSWLIEQGAPKDATDDVLCKAAGEALATGKLAVEKYAELTADPKGAEANEFAKKFDALTKSVSDLVGVLTKDKTEKEGKVCPKCGGKMDEKGTTCTKCGYVEGKQVDPPEKKGGAGETPPEGEKGGKADWYEKMINRLNSGIESGSVDVQGAWEGYKTTRSTLSFPETTKSGRPHSLAGKPVIDGVKGRPLESASELDQAVAGAYAKFMISTAQRGGSRTFGFQSLPQHDKELMYYALEHMEWGGSTDGGNEADIKSRKLSSREQKALIDDATSGGIEAAPIVFDDQVIQTPLLNGELYPLVNTKPLDRGRRVEGVSTGTVTGSWGGVDDTAISLFSTTSYVSAFDTTIFRWEGAIKIGLDFLSDTPIDFGAHVTSQYGERLLEDLDDVIAAGNGTTQPEGVINKSGTTSITFSSTTSIGNYESLRFGVTKPEHKGGVASSAVFCGTETSYQRARAIPVGASDARRLGGMNYDTYQWMERPYKINESLSNAQIFYAILARYRMYRRRGLTIRTSTEGDTLIRANEMLIAVMARWGGQLERGGAAAVTTDAPA